MSTTCLGPLSETKRRFRELVTPIRHDENGASKDRFVACVRSILNGCLQREKTGPKETRLKQIIIRILACDNFHDRIYMNLLAMLTCQDVIASVVFDSQNRTDQEIADFVAYLGQEFDAFVKGLSTENSEHANESNLKYRTPEHWVHAMLLKAWTI